MYFFVSNYLAAEYCSVPNTCLQIRLCYHNGFYVACMFLCSNPKCMFYRDLSCDYFIYTQYNNKNTSWNTVSSTKRNKVKIQNVLFKNLCLRNTNISKMTYFKSNKNFLQKHYAVNKTSKWKSTLQLRLTEILRVKQLNVTMLP